MNASQPAPGPSETRPPIEERFSAGDIAALNDRYRSLSPEARIARLYEDFDEDRVMLTSSFAATSAFLLHMFSRARPSQPVHFIDTGYHFPETLAYKADLIRRYGLKVLDVRAEAWRHEFTARDETWKKDPDFCCSINKVEPLEAVRRHFDVWASGLMRWQTEHRATLDIFEIRGSIIKFYPLIDVSREERDAYIRRHRLPFHPLVDRGYASIGCTHCTAPGQDRSGRWNNSPKTECGLHL